MSKVYVSEYAAASPNGRQTAPEPCLAEQIIDFTSGVATITLGPQTRYVRLQNDAICSLRYDGSNATTSNARSPAETIEYKDVQPGGKISAISNT
jgi:hypothetical protein